MGDCMEWTGAYLKQNAKNILKTNYWTAFAISLLLLLAGGGKGFSFQYSFGGPGADGYFPYLNQLILGLAALIACGTFLYRIFVGYSLETGVLRYFVQSGQQNFATNTLGFGFKYYWNIIGVRLSTDIFIFLWTLLLIIPGIIKFYQYYFVPYLLTDNPYMDASRARELSKQMTKGYKINIWILQLSFIGWYLLGALACGIGVLFVEPYVQSTYAQLYLTHRYYALNTNMCTYEELNLVPAVAV